MKGRTMHDLDVPEPFRRIAGHIGETSHSGSGVKIQGKDIAGIGGQVAGPSNWYPGTPSNQCYEDAYFVSLRDPRYANRRANLSLEKAIEKLVQHLSGDCAEVTTKVYFLCDSWEPELVLSRWRPIIAGLRRPDVEIKAWFYNDRQFLPVDLCTP